MAADMTDETIAQYMVSLQNKSFGYDLLVSGNFM